MDEAKTVEKIATDIEKNIQSVADKEINNLMKNLNLGTIDGFGKSINFDKELGSKIQEQVKSQIYQVFGGTNMGDITKNLKSALNLTEINKLTADLQGSIKAITGDIEKSIKNDIIGENFAKELAKVTEAQTQVQQFMSEIQDFQNAIQDQINAELNSAINDLTSQIGGDIGGSFNIGF